MSTQQTITGVQTGQKPLAVSYVPINKLRRDPRNSRVHSKNQIRQIAKSIQSFGFNVPVLVDEGLNVLAGHGRILAAEQLGWTELPTIQLDHLTEPQRRAFMLADNRMTEIATWDDRLLAEQLKELSSVELDFDIEATGFDMAEIDLRIESLSAPATEPAERAIPVPSGPVISRCGDLWLMGRHKLFCGSALEVVSYTLLMGLEKASAVFTDPPYNVPIEGHVCGLGQFRHREFEMAAGEMDSAAFTEFLQTALELMARFTRPGSLAFVAMDWRHLAELLAAARKDAVEMLNLCVWTKPNGGMGSLYRSQHELIFVFKLGSGRHRNNVQLGRYNRNRTNVWTYAVGPGFGRAGEEGRLARLHPTIKPMNMIADAILDCTRRGDLVLDPFLGSGTSLIAAERTGRSCRGMEIDPLYVDVIVRRWQDHTGADARHATTGETFDAIAGLRSASDREQRD